MPLADSTGIAPDDSSVRVLRSERLEGVAADKFYFAPLIAVAHQALRSEYRDIEAIGPGRSGFVFRARRITTADTPERDDWVALKVAFHGVAESSGVFRRFQRLARVGAKLHHPNIASVSAVRSRQGVTWYEMPFLGGVRLDRAMRNERTFTIAHAIGILRELASALDYAATQGVVHGGLRPSEIVIQPNGHAVLSGFMLDVMEPRDHPALMPSALGDPAYMPPEQWADKSPIPPATDQFALAVLAAELFGGAPRVQRNDSGMAEVVPLHIDRDRAMRPGLGLHVNEALLRATARDPHLRFASSSMFVAALDNPPRPAHHLPETNATEVVSRIYRWRLMLVLVGVLLAVALSVIR